MSRQRGLEVAGTGGGGSLPPIQFTTITSRLALLEDEAGLHALPRIEPGLLRLSARVAPLLHLIGKLCERCLGKV